MLSSAGALALLTLSPVVFGLALAAFGLWGSKANLAARLAFLAVQFLLIYYSGYASLPGLAFTGLVILLFGVFASNRGTMIQLLAAAPFIVFVLYWVIEKYAVPLYFAPDLAAHNPAVASARHVTELIAIAGISYIGFKLIHFFVDLRAGQIEKADPIEVLTWLFFFPSILAGPMQRYQDWQEQRAYLRFISAEDAVIGIQRIAIGVLMKFGIADNIHNMTLPMAPLGALAAAPISSLIFGAFIYSAYLYLDFAGYCHIAIGGARFMGIHLPENFNKPYIARNLADFWNRWHITLSQILRDYLFYPLSLTMKRVPFFRRMPNFSSAAPPLITFIIAGIWHGAGWPFVIYGLIHGVGLAFLAVRRRNQKETPFAEWWRRSIVGYTCDTAINLSYVTLSFVFFSLPVSSLMLLWARFTGHVGL